MAAIVQWLERLIVVQDVVGSNPTSRPIFLFAISYGTFRTGQSPVLFICVTDACHTKNSPLSDVYGSAAGQAKTLIKKERPRDRSF